VDAAPDQGPLHGLLAPAVAECFRDLDLEDEGIAGYLARLLVRFTTADAVHPPGAGGRRQETIADRLAEIQRAWDAARPGFDPRRELSLQRDLGDHALFMSGFFWERVRSMGARRLYLRTGRRAYRFVAACYRALDHPDAPRFARLARRFETYAAVLSYLRDVHLDGDLAPGSRRPPPRFIVP
jgi:hypothetical protein